MSNILAQFPISSLAQVLAGVSVYFPDKFANAPESMTEYGLARYLSGEESFDNGSHYRTTCDAIRGELFKQFSEIVRSGNEIDPDKQKTLLGIVEAIDPRTPANKVKIADSRSDEKYSPEEVLFIRERARELFQIKDFYEMLEKEESSKDLKRGDLTEDEIALNKLIIEEISKKTSELTVQFSEYLEGFGSIRLAALEKDKFTSPDDLLTAELKRKGRDLADPKFLAAVKEIAANATVIDPDDLEASFAAILSKLESREKTKPPSKEEEMQDYEAASAIIAKVLSPRKVDTDRIFTGGNGSVFIPVGKGEDGKQSALKLADSFNRFIKNTIYRTYNPAQVDKIGIQKFAVARTEFVEGEECVKIDTSVLKRYLQGFPAVMRDTANKFSYMVREVNLEAEHLSGNSNAKLSDIIRTNFRQEGDRMIFAPQPHHKPDHHAIMLALVSREGIEAHVPEHTLDQGSPAFDVTPNSTLIDIIMQFFEVNIAAKNHPVAGKSSVAKKAETQLYSAYSPDDALKEFETVQLALENGEKNIFKKAELVKKEKGLLLSFGAIWGQQFIDSLPPEQREGLDPKLITFSRGKPDLAGAPEDIIKAVAEYHKGLNEAIPGLIERYETLEECDFKTLYRRSRGEAWQAKLLLGKSEYTETHPEITHVMFKTLMRIPFDPDTLNEGRTSKDIFDGICDAKNPAALLRHVANRGWKPSIKHGQTDELGYYLEGAYKVVDPDIVKTLLELGCNPLQIITKSRETTVGSWGTKRSFETSTVTPLDQLRTGEEYYRGSLPGTVPNKFTREEVLERFAEAIKAVVEIIGPEQASTRKKG